MVAITDDQGDLISQQRYLPFGGVRTIPNSPITNTDYGYTGQRNLDDDLGLMDYNFRFYSPTLGRFILPDNIIPDTTNPQSWNRYSYVNNNPINFNDPTGHCPCVAPLVVIPVAEFLYIALLVAVGIGSTVDTTQFLQHNDGFRDFNKNVSIKDIITFRTGDKPPYVQPPKDPKKNPIVEMLDETAKAVKLLCERYPKTCLAIAGVGLVGQLFGTNAEGKPNPFHCKVNRNAPECKYELPTMTPTPTPTMTPYYLPNNNIPIPI